MERLGGIGGKFKAAYSPQETSHRDVSQRPLEFARLSQLRWGEGKNLDAFYSTIPVEPEIYRRVQEFYVFILFLSLKDTYGQNDSYYS